MLFYYFRLAMPLQTSFDISEWLSKSVSGGTHLTPDAHKAIADFTVMWIFFESLACKNNASVRAFERLVAEADLGDLPVEVLDTVDNCISFWTFRYRTPDGFSERFLGLNFRPNDQRDHVEQVLTGKRRAVRDVVLALAIIVYRLRNNLFHGLKTLDMLNDQVSNLNMASRCLGTLLQVSQTIPLQRAPREASYLMR